MVARRGRLKNCPDISITPNELHSSRLALDYVTIQFLILILQRPKEGLQFLESRASNWQPRASLTQHMWWHQVPI
jgi:hypothetical protein